MRLKILEIARDPIWKVHRSLAVAVAAIAIAAVTAHVGSSSARAEEELNTVESPIDDTILEDGGTVPLLDEAELEAEQAAALYMIQNPQEVEDYLRQFRTVEELAAEERAQRMIMDPLRFGDEHDPETDPEMAALREAAEHSIRNPVLFDPDSQALKSQRQLRLEAAAMSTLRGEAAAETYDWVELLSEESEN
jgi:hypothetical protein